MSAESAAKFWRALERDGKLRSAVNGTTTNRGGKRGIESSAIVALAQRHGFTFTADELVAFLRGARDRQLSEREMESVAGGSGGMKGKLEATILWHRGFTLDGKGTDVNVEEVEL